jgi:hypothetical protein
VIEHATRRTGATNRSVPVAGKLQHHGRHHFHPRFGENAGTSILETIRALAAELSVPETFEFACRYPADATCKRMTAMKKTALVLGTAALLTAATAAAPAQARGWGWGPGIIGGLAAGALIAGATTAAYGYGPYGYYGGGPYYGGYGYAPAYSGYYGAGYGYGGYGGYYRPRAVYYGGYYPRYRSSYSYYPRYRNSYGYFGGGPVIRAGFGPGWGHRGWGHRGYRHW